MKAVVLVGGFGTRLRPLTLHTPKQMLPIVDRPMIEWVLAHLARHGVDEAVLSLGYRTDDFERAYPDNSCAGVKLHYAVEPEPLDTAGAIRFAALDAGIDERFLVMNGDVLTDLDIGALVDFHVRSQAEGTITLHEVDDPSRYGVVPTDDAGRVIAFVEKPPPGEAPTNLINAGTYVLEPSVLDRIPPDRKVSIERETFPAMVAEGTLFATSDRGVYWLDTGTPETYIRAQLDVVEGRRTVGAPAKAVGPGARIAATAVVDASVIGAGVVVGADAEIVGSIVQQGASIGAKARIINSIIGERASVGDGATVEEVSVIGPGEIITAGAVLQAARVPESD